ncbi:hypothetical protein [Shigella flexneri]|uniref:hypothetical protein n=1 Tax=Shigella flexneri TaxID=623 RepID=UPI0025425A70|nr:hypothetical protein [Shigella flexneri]
MRELEGIAFCHKTIVIILAGHKTLTLRRCQVNAHQLSLLPGKGEHIAIAVTDFCQQTISADKINPVAIIIEDSGQPPDAIACRGKELCLLRTAIENAHAIAQASRQPVVRPA